MAGGAAMVAATTTAAAAAIAGRRSTRAVNMNDPPGSESRLPRAEVRRDAPVSPPERSGHGPDRTIERQAVAGTWENRRILCQNPDWTRKSVRSDDRTG